MSTFRYSICDPFSPEIIEKGSIDKAGFLKVFHEFPWEEMLHQMEEAENSVSGKDIHYSPSLEVENRSNKNGLSISVVDGKDEPEFYIFYKRPEIRKYLFGFIQKMDENFVSDRTSQTKADALAAINALFDNDLALLKSRWG
ncbi:hypothetical protein [Adhaeribacter terreus]|uniref:Uncharacterized protein n=1 Tax=Adhaeribacter terreus TaxID=529703 RepID=A0ABW0EA91_9BACT